MTDVNRSIILSIGADDFTFTLDAQLVTKYFNGITATNKVAPSHNLLVTAVAQEQLAALRPLLGNPATTLKIAGALLEEYAPDVEITVKKPSLTLNA